MHSLILFPLILQLVLYSVLILEAKCNTCTRNYLIDWIRGRG